MSDAEKPDKYTLVDAEDVAYAILREIVGAHHTDIAEAEIALVWVHDVKADTDGHLVWGKAKKIGPLERQFHAHDFAIMLNFAVWRELPEAARRALLDHELSHCGVKTSEDGEESYYMRKHDLEEFNHIVRRHGLWREGVESFVNAALRKDVEPADGTADLFPAKSRDLGPGVES